MDRFKVIGFLMIIVGVLFGGTLAGYDYVINKPEPRVEGVLDNKLTVETLSSLSTPKNTASSTVSSISQDKKIPNATNVDSESTKSLLLSKVSKKCIERIQKENSFGWEIAPNDRIFLNSNEQILILPCGNGVTFYNMFYYNLQSKKIDLLPFEKYIPSTQTIISENEIDFSPSSSNTGAMQFAGLTNTKNSFNCGIISSYSWYSQLLKYKLEKVKVKDCTNAKLGIIDEVDWQTAYPLLD
jgi:hypothetical protein